MRTLSYEQLIRMNDTEVANYWINGELPDLDNTVARLIEEEREPSLLDDPFDNAA